MAELATASVPRIDQTAQTRQRYIAQIENRYALEDKGAVWQFLYAHPDLAPILIRAYDHLQAQVPEVQIELRVVQEPEVPDWRQLLAAVRTALPVDQALALLERLSDEWFSKQPAWVDDLFILDVECV
jgi:hypothetical protein